MSAFDSRCMNKHFWRHYVEMVVAMGVGMAVLGPLVMLIADAAGWSYLLGRTEPMALSMAAEMSAGMAAWMRFRGHTWRPILEMCAAMFAPFLFLFVPYWLDWFGPTVLMIVGHVLMLPAMLVVMMRRVDEYGTHRHHSKAQARHEPVS
jgi:hypothetical protein